MADERDTVLRRVLVQLSSLKHSRHRHRAFHAKKVSDALCSIGEFDIAQVVVGYIELNLDYLLCRAINNVAKLIKEQCCHV